MQLAQLIYHGRETVLHQIIVEEVGEQLLLTGLIVGIEHPWCLIQHNILQFLILFELAYE